MMLSILLMTSKIVYTSIRRKLLLFPPLITLLVSINHSAFARCTFRNDDGTCLNEIIYGRCLLKVDGTIYLNGKCAINIDMNHGVETGDFSIGTDGKSEYFAYVNDHGRSATWNAGASHAHAPLGTLSKKGACWTNSHAKVCAWR
jgi:hypothetical protein